MAKKKIGYVELHWGCPNCGTINPGPVKVCEGCGAPQPEDVEFFQASQQELIQDQEKIKQAQSGADIHCGYCGTRNPADAQSCSQCKADLTAGKKRKSGQVIGAFKSGPAQNIACPQCGAQNKETDQRCSQCGGNLARQTPSAAAQSRPVGDRLPKVARPVNRSVLAVLALVMLAGCIAIYFIFLRTTATTGTVTELHWERSVVLEGLIPVEYKAWLDQIPDDAEIISCAPEAYKEVDQPAEGAQEICGTPYTQDTGSGFAEVVEDCTYIVYEDYCSFTILEFGYLDTISTSGDNLAAQSPNPSLAADQRLGESDETYQITFTSDGKTYIFSTSNYDLFQQAQIGSQWELEINSIGGVQSIHP